MPRKNITPINRGIESRLPIPRTIERKPEKKGRPRKKISLTRVTKMFMANCTIKETAADQGICEKTLGEFIYEQMGMKSDEYKQHCFAAGNATLKEVQYDKAIAGDNTMLIFLGKDRLGQSDRRDLTLHVDLLSDFVNAPGTSLLKSGESMPDFEARLLEGA